MEIEIPTPNFDPKYFPGKRRHPKWKLQFHLDALVTHLHPPPPMPVRRPHQSSASTCHSMSQMSLGNSFFEFSYTVYASLENFSIYIGIQSISIAVYILELSLKFCFKIEARGNYFGFANVCLENEPSYEFEWPTHYFLNFVNCHFKSYLISQRTNQQNKICHTHLLNI